MNVLGIAYLFTLYGLGGLENHADDYYRHMPETVQSVSWFTVNYADYDKETCP